MLPFDNFLHRSMLNVNKALFTLYYCVYFNYILECMCCCCLENEKKLKSEVDTLKSKNLDLERAERLVRVDLEQLSKRVSVFKCLNRVVFCIKEHKKSMKV